MSWVHVPGCDVVHPYGEDGWRPRSDGTHEHHLGWDDTARWYGTDKSSERHGYMAHYERLLSGRDVRRVLEVGVDRGASIRTWAALWPDATVVGVDVDPAACAAAAAIEVESPGVRVVCADAATVDGVRRVLAVEPGPFDLIVDDGSHRLEDVEATARLLSGELAPGGVYVVEDAIVRHLHRARWPAPLPGVVAALHEVGLTVRTVERSTLMFVAGNVEHGWCSLVAADRP